MSMWDDMANSAIRKKGGRWANYSGGVAGAADASRQAREDEARNRQRAAQVPHFNQQYGQYGRMADQFGNRQVENSPFRQNQQQVGQMLMNEARGQGIGQQVIRNQAQGMADRGMAQQLSMAASARPGQGAAAARNAAFNSAGINSNVGGQVANAAGQMQLGAMGQAGQFFTGARGQDDDLRLRQLGLNDQSQLNALGQRLQLSGMQQQGGQFSQSLEEQRRQFNKSQPSTFDKFLGAAGGGLTWATGAGWKPF